MSTSTEPDYRLDGFTAATAEVERDFFHATISDDSFVPLAAHHSPDDRDSYLLFFDQSATWGIPGSPAYVALHLTRDAELGTFRFSQETHPLVPLGQRWLIEQGCPPEGIGLTNTHGLQPADPLTTLLENRLRTGPEDRMKVLDHYTNDEETWALLHDTDPASAELPFRVFLEEVSFQENTYTVREGAFATADAADDWLSDRDTPLPPAPALSRAEAAGARSPRAPDRPADAPNPVPPARPTATEAVRTGRGRS
ncbi:hypothetical protein [Streptomyces tsukubensis]|uniref:Glycosyl hydrolase n=1 Tax=Streptomyces tsukubensis (strain DSM 42081 / NBRC 108919 / NRRL 18488 / 9993) TaxID=1114943 RepID=A0A7G3UEG6_STRT9|nr:hypothetical protein [Streptomyces tsukubensis]AZK96625.1 hypothetical protein B7R87_24230 [Streptomyces tsukubensis]QKM67372.1 hypothetical protein STSU_009535 [Streptomyces tsukubensis NRRL18488]TAI42075.1 hypothetical protein EWI31_24395 [Streptomyces tsukubensis]